MTLHKNTFISSFSSPHNIGAHKKSAVSEWKDTDTCINKFTNMSADRSNAKKAKQNENAFASGYS